jgi:CubicO group peptidase (beta-lactamase class C family)
MNRIATKLKATILSRALARAATRCLALCGSLIAVVVASADEIDDVVAAQMREWHIAGLSLAIVDGGKIARAQGYGFADKTSEILSCACHVVSSGSVSKAVAAFAHCGSSMKAGRHSMRT